MENFFIYSSASALAWKLLASICQGWARKFYGGAVGNPKASKLMVYQVSYDILIIVMETLKKYGPIGIATHLTLSWTFFGGLYILASRSRQVHKLVRYLNLQDKIPKSAGPLVVAGIIYKATMPVRIVVSVAATPYSLKLYEKITGVPVEPIPILP